VVAVRCTSGHTPTHAPARSHAPGCFNKAEGALTLERDADLNHARAAFSADTSAFFQKMELSTSFVLLAAACVLAARVAAECSGPEVFGDSYHVEQLAVGKAPRLQVGKFPACRGHSSCQILFVGGAST